MKKRAAGLTAILAIGGLLTASATEATTVTVGSPGPASTVSALLGGPTAATIVNTAIPGATVTAPGNGVITSWRIANATGGPFSIQVVHPSAGAFTSTGTASGGVATSSGTVTFAANLPIAKGDYIGLLNTNPSDHIGAAATPGSSFIFFSPALGATPRTPDGSGPGEIGFNADVLLNCVVPKLKGKKVGAARKALANAGCAAPKVKKKGGKFVRKQSAKPGTEIRGDAVVTLKAGPRKK